MLKQVYLQFEGGKKERVTFDPADMNYTNVRDYLIEYFNGFGLRLVRMFIVEK